MNDIKALRCPSCGGPLDFDNQERSLVRCQYCGTSLVVPEELRSSGRQNIYGSLSEQVENMQRIGELVRGGKKIEAIKLYRSTFDVDLKEAKEAIDNLIAGRPIQAGNMTVETYSTSAEFPSVFDPATAVAIGGAAAASSTGCGCTSLVSLIILIVIVVGAALFFIPNSPIQELLGIENPISLPAEIEELINPDETAAFAEAALTFGGKGIGPGTFSDARYIGIDWEDNIYVGDYDTGQVQVFNEAGEYVSQWKIEQEGYILSMAVSVDGVVYLNNGGDILVFEGISGELLEEYRVDRVNLFKDLAFTYEGNLIATWHEGGADNVLAFDEEGSYSIIAEDVIHGATGDAELNPLVAVDWQGNIYLLGTFNNVVVKLSPDGDVMARFGSDGDEPGQFRGPSAITVDNLGRIYVADIWGIQVFDETGRYLETITVPASVRGMIFNQSNDLFVVTLDQTIIKYVIQE